MPYKIIKATRKDKTRCINTLSTALLHYVLDVAGQYNRVSTLTELGNIIKTNLFSLLFSVLSFAFPFLPIPDPIRL